MKRAYFSLLPVVVASAMAAQMTGIFIGDRERTLYVGSEPFCLVFPHPVQGGRVASAGFALAVQDRMACFTALEPGSQSAATLEVGDRTLNYLLKARLDVPSAEIRVIFPGDAGRMPVTTAASAESAVSTDEMPRQSKSAAAEVAAAKNTEAAVALPVSPEVENTVVVPQPDPTVQRLEGLIAKLDRVLKAQAASDVRYLPEAATAPSRVAPEADATPAASSNEAASSDGEEAPADGLAPAPKEGKGPGTQVAEAPSDQAGPVGYAPVEDPLPEGVRVITSLVPGKETWRITYTLYNDGEYPLITDPQNVRVRFNEEPVETGELKQRTSSGYAGWVPPGYEEVGSIEVPALRGQGELRLEFALTRLSPERERLTIARRWKITTMPYVVPNEP